ncbi:MAG: hypothetical protein MJ213_04165 [Bacilli bacterium]|nr:hypothetical protein [Bacilli bacterium]
MSKKIRPSHKYTYIVFFILFVALTFLLWAICGTHPWNMQYESYVNERLWIELTYIACSFLVCATGAFIYRLKVYYIVDNKKITRTGTKERGYFFNDIIYLDEEYTNKHGDMLIYINTGKWVNLTMDSKKELLKIVKEKCHLLSKEEFAIKHPDAVIRK